MKALSWKPRHQRGGIYCSPACGAGCKYADYREALAKAKALAAIAGPGWKPYVHENCGWYWMIENGVARISESTFKGRKSYTLYFDSFRQLIGEAATIKGAVAIVCRNLKTMNRDFAKIERGTK